MNYLTVIRAKLVGVWSANQSCNIYCLENSAGLYADKPLATIRINMVYDVTPFYHAYFSRDPIINPALSDNIQLTEHHTRL